MRMISVPVFGLNAPWSPAPYAPAIQGMTRRLGQAAATAAVPVPVPKPSLIDIDAPLASFLTAMVASTSTAILGHSFGKVHSRWSTVFWLMSGITGFKALVDLSRLR